MNDPDPARVTSREEFAECLRHLHTLADRPPSYRELEKRTAKAPGLLPGTKLRRVPLKRATIADVLAGTTFPRKAFLLTFVEACDVDLETDGQWVQAWNRLAPQYQRSTPETEVEQLRQLLTAAERRAAAAEQRATRAEARLRQAIQGGTTSKPARAGGAIGRLGGSRAPSAEPPAGGLGVPPPLPHSGRMRRLVKSLAVPEEDSEPPEVKPVKQPGQLPARSRRGQR